MNQYLLSEDVFRVDVQVGIIGLDFLLEFFYALLLPGLLFVVVGLFFDQALD